jgi:hypothetical protein
MVMSYGSWIYNYLCNLCLSPLKLSLNPVHVSDLRQVTGRWFFRGTLMSSTNAADGYDITEILLKVMLRPINLNLFPYLALEIKTSLWVPLLEQYFLFISEHQTVIKNCVRFLILSNQKMIFSKYKILIGLFIVCFIYEYKNNTQKFYA